MRTDGSLSSSSLFAFWWMSDQWLQSLPAGADYTLFAEPGIAVVGSALSYYAPVTAIKVLGLRGAKLGYELFGPGGK